jgi:hypothetical protein
MHKKKYQTIGLLALCVAGALLWWFTEQAAPAYRPPSPETGVWLEGKNGQYTLKKEGQPFFIKGASGHGHYRELAQAGANTLRVYDTVGLGAVLDSAYSHGLMVIADLPIPASQHQDFYRDTAKTAALKLALFGVVAQHQQHPALLLWNFGNEVNFGLEPGRRAFYRFYNQTLADLKGLDPHHPFSSSLTTYRRRELLGTRLRVRGLDMLGFNSFGQIINQERNLKRFAWVWKGPYLLTEWGVNGYWESGFTSWRAPLELSSPYKCFQVAEHYQRNMPHGDPRFLGHCFFYWGTHHESTPTWFGAFDAAGRETPLYAALAALWQGDSVPLPSIPLEGVSINGIYPNKDVFAKPGQPMYAQIALYEGRDSAFTVRWELRPEDWYSARWPYGPESRPLNWEAEPFRQQGVKFSAPEREGPYRLYAYLSDRHGLTLTANSPLYVVR